MDIRQLLIQAGACEDDIESLTDYVRNRFSKKSDSAADAGDDFLERWEPILASSQTAGAAQAVNRHLAGGAPITFLDPDKVALEIYPSIAGRIPIIRAENTADFESLVMALIFKGKAPSNISSIGAMFAFGKKNRFIILSNKPYSNVPAAEMGLEGSLWRERSYLIRREHECTHYYTKRYLGSSQNNLHDELIADFAGYHKAFGEYRAEWFIRALDKGRFGVYTGSLSESAAVVVRKLIVRAAGALEVWSKTEGFSHMTEEERIRALCGKSLTGYITE